MEDYFLLVPRASVVASWCSVDIANTTLPGLGTNDTRVSWSFNPNKDLNSWRSHLAFIASGTWGLFLRISPTYSFDLQVAAMQHQQMTRSYLPPRSCHCAAMDIPAVSLLLHLVLFQDCNLSAQIYVYVRSQWIWSGSIAALQYLDTILYRYGLYVRKLHLPR